MNVGVFVWEVSRWLHRFMKMLQKIALELFVHSCENRNSSVRTADAGGPGKSRMKQKIPHKYARCPVFAGAACLLKMHEKSLAAHLATHSSSFSCHIKNHPVTAGLVLSQDLSLEANGNKFRLCCICGAREEVMERARAAANLFLLQDSLHRRNGLNQLNTHRFRTWWWILLNWEGEDQVCVCRHSWTK